MSARRRNLRGTLALYVSLTLLAMGAAAGTARADLYAMVIGIDAYQQIRPLHGAVNDARDIADAIAGLEPDQLVVLLDGEASRARILQVWRDFAARADADDTILVTYAGHGANEPATYPESERDGKDETLLLAGFQPVGPGAGERIRDDEIAELIALSRATTVFVADSCHSGTATRGVNDQMSYRFYNYGGLVDDPLPPPPPPPQGVGRQDMSSREAIFFGAVADSEQAPEVEIDGQMRGALSYAFADGLRGRADRNGDGIIAKGEMETHIRRYIKNRLDGRQKPQVAPAGAIDRPLIAAKSAPLRDPTAFSVAFDALPPVPVQVIPPASQALMIQGLRGAVAATQIAGRGVVVDLSQQEIRSATGDRLRRLTREVGADPLTQVQGMVDKMRAVYALQDGALSGDLDVELLYGDDLYYADEEVDIMIRGRHENYITIVSLPPDGTISWIYPRYPPLDRSGGFLDPETIRPDEPLSFAVEAIPPFGAEHVIVIETPVPLEAVRRAAMRYDGQPYIDKWWDDLNAALGERPHKVGLHGFYTRETPPD